MNRLRWEGDKALITVFYDGQCGLCRREIKYYQKIANPEYFIWLDIGDNIETLKQRNLSAIDALKEIYVLDGDGTLHVGVDGFILIWSNLRYWKIIGFVASCWPIKPILVKLYGLFAKKRFHRLYR